MGKLIYLITTSLDGYVADETGNFDWGAPTEEVHAFINDQLRSVGTFLMGRKLYKTMAVWDTISTDGPSAGMNEFAGIWRAASKVVYSTSLSEVSIANAKIEHTFNPEAVQKMVAASDKDFDIGGPHLAGAVIKAGIVDEYHHFIVPIMIGGGNPWLPQSATNQLKLIDMRRFENGLVYLHYRKI